jgi:glutathione S-transferase
MTRPILYVGNKNYSSWSMRGWLALRWGGVEFEEKVIPLGGEGYGKSQIRDVLAVSPSGRVPALHADGVVIHDSLAISEWAAERAPSLWPAETGTRALARSASAEMHSSFAALRRDLSMNIRRRMDRTPDLQDDVRADLDRLFQVWSDARKAYAGAGPYLFGARTIADVMYAPVATRLRTYNISTPPIAQAYCDTIFADDGFQEWESAALAETWTIEQTESLYQ